jgi:D-lactate dehydrogenase (cytochrome)
MNTSPTIQACTDIVGSDHIATDDATLRLCAHDVFMWDDAQLPLAVAAPADTAQVAALMRAAATHGFVVAPRGGGVSYTKGYVPVCVNTVTLDTSRLDAIFEINTADLYVTVGAGCTWQKLSEALKGKGLRPVVKGPISGTHATVGGLAAQNAGSANMSGFLALEVVLADGRIVATGSSAAKVRPSPFYRNYGPDLTGLFLGDTGAFAIKTKCTLALEPEPQGMAFATLGFQSLPEMVEVMTVLSRSLAHCRLFGMDPVKNRTATKVGMAEGLGTLAKVVTAAGSMTEGLKQAARIAVAGSSVLADTPWSLHVTLEGHDQTAADHMMAAARPLWAGRAREVEPSVPIAMRARPYSIRGIVGPNGERWVPIHGLFPLSRAVEAAQRTLAFFGERVAELERYGIQHSYITSASAGHWLIEPMFYWFDELTPLHAKALGDKFEKFKDIPANPAARAVVKASRSELAALFHDLGAVHSQIGKFYDFPGGLDPTTYGLLSEFKALLDPKCRLNPGNLGWR